MMFKEFVRRVGIGAILACAAATAGAQIRNELRQADDLTATAREARARRAPIMIAFTQASCRFCHAAKRDFLIPMHNSPDLRDRVIIREVDVDSGTVMRDFEGRLVTPKEFSKRYQVKKVPSVIVVDDKGALLSSPIIGLLADDFYRLYLERAIEEGLDKLRPQLPG